MKSRGSTAVAICFVTALLMAVPARPDTFFYDGVHYNYRVNDVPDIDQRRGPDAGSGVLGIPGNGNMYCAPTSVVNWTAYLSNHGYPGFVPGPGNWEVSPPANLAEYNHVSGSLFLMGLILHTSVTTGTGGMHDYLQDYFDDIYPGQFMIVTVGADKDWSPRARDASVMAFWDGLVIVVMGWYTNADISPIHIRKGGHVVTMAGAEDDDVVQDLKLNDPAFPNDGMLTTQSSYTANSTLFHPEDAIYCWWDAVNNFPTDCYERTQDRLTYTGSGYLDGYTAIIPKYGLTYNLGHLILLKPVSPSTRHAAVQTIEAGGMVADVAIDPVRVAQPFLVEGRDSVSKIDLINGEIRPFIERVHAPRRLAYGGKSEELYVLTDDAIAMYDRDGRPVASIALRKPLDAIAFDEKNNRLVGISRVESSLFLYDSRLRQEQRLSLPPGLMNRGGRTTLTINPANGQIWSFNDGAQFATQITIAGDGRARTVARPLPKGTAAPQTIHIDERGTLFVVVDGHIVPIDAEGRVLRSSRFFGMPAGAGLQIARPFTNENERMTGPSFNNVLPEDADRLTRGQ